MARSLAEKINYLFETVRPAGRGPYTNAEAASATGLAQSYIGYLRSGKRQNPTMQTLDALSRFFGVPVAYFHDDDVFAGRVEQQLQQLGAMAALNQALKREGVQKLAARMGDLSDGGIAAIGQLVDLLLEKEGRGGRPADQDANGGP